MKIMNRITVIVLLVLVSGVVSAETENQNTPKQFYFQSGNLDLPVVFEDSTLSLNERKEILDDYYLILNHLTVKGRRSIDKKTLKGDKNVKLQDALVFQGKYKKRPNGYEDQYGIIGQTEDGSEYLVVPQKLSDRYKFALNVKNKEMEAFDKLNSFLDFMNNLDTLPIPPLADLLYLSEGAETYSDELANWKGEGDNFRKAYGSHQYRKSSLLEFKKGVGDQDGKFLSKIIILDMNGDIIGDLPIIYDGGYWKLFVTIPAI